MIVIAIKPFAEGDFVKDCLLKDSEIVCPDKKLCFANTSLSRNTVTQRVNEITYDLTAQLRNKATVQFFSIAADETMDNRHCTSYVLGAWCR